MVDNPLLNWYILYRTYVPIREVSEMFDWLDVEQFKAYYDSEEACARALFDAKWPDGFRCDRCHGRQAYYIQTRMLYECVDCHYQSSLTAGTIMARTRTSLRKWFLALFMISRLDGISATELKQLLQVTYKTAWTMLMKIRYAISQEHESHTLSGMVRLNPAIYGERISTKLSHLGPGEYPVVIGASVNEAGEPDRLKIKRVDLSQSWGHTINRWHIKGFQSRYVDADATEVLTSTGGRDRFLPLIHIVKRAEDWMNKTFIAVSEKHWQKYIDEFCFRYSLDEGYRYMMRTSGSCMYIPRGSCWAYRVRPVEQRLRYASSTVFQSILRLGMTQRALTYAQIISWYASRSESITPYYAA